LKQEWKKSPAGTRQTYGEKQVWFGEIEQKISQIIEDYLYLPFFHLFILWIACTNVFFFFQVLGTGSFFKVRSTFNFMDRCR
jgi:hypothetical protein